MLSRRTALASISALAAVAAMPAIAQPGSSSRPRRLRRGDAVGLVAPGMFSDDLAKVEEIKSTVTAMGLVPRAGRYLTARYGYLAGTDQQRAQDLNAMYADPQVRAVFAVHGGWGSARLLPYVDWRVIRANPKLLIGSSDITALHLAFAAQQAGFPTIHGPNVAYNWFDISWNSFWSLAFEAGTPVLSSAGTEVIRPGKASGGLIGGNLSVFASLVGTPWLPDCKGAILFLEDAGEAEYRIDRMMTQLALAGILRNVAGVVFGQCTRCTGNVPNYSGFTVPQVLYQHLAPLGVPAFRGANLGHVSNQLCVPVGVRAEIDAAAGTIRILEPVVA